MYLRDLGVGFGLENANKENTDCCAIGVLDGIVGGEIALAQDIRLAAVRFTPFEYGVVNGPAASFVPMARDPSGFFTFVETRTSPMNMVAAPPTKSLIWSTNS